MTLSMTMAAMTMIMTLNPRVGVSPPDSDAPRMDATDSDGFSQSCLFNYQSLEITYGLELMAAGSQVTSSVVLL